MAQSCGPPSKVGVCAIYSATTVHQLTPSLSLVMLMRFEQQETISGPAVGACILRLAGRRRPVWGA